MWTTLLYTGIPMGLILAAALSVLTTAPLSRGELQTEDRRVRARLRQIARPALLLGLAATWWGVGLQLQSL